MSERFTNVECLRQVQYETLSTAYLGK